MNFQVQVSKERLDKVLGVLKHALEKRVTLPILQHIVMDISDREMAVKATDMELAFEASLPIESSGSKQVAVPGKKLVETVKVYPEGILTLDWPDDGNRMWLRAKGFNSEHNVQNSEGFPELPKPDASCKVVELPTALFKKALVLGGLAISKDATKPALSGVLLHFTNDFVRVVSTDGFRLAVAELPLTTGLESETRIIVPKRSMDLVAGAFEDDSPIELSWDDRSLFLNQQNLKFSTRRVTANYPGYEKVLPSSPGALPLKVVVDKEEFSKRLRFVGLKKDDYNKTVRLIFDFPTLKVQIQHPDEGINQASLNYSGPDQDDKPLELAFNIDYLTELLDRIHGEEVEYHYKDDVASGVFTSPSLKDLSFKYILMPVKFGN
jgi:DNA polymerase-3 subunit beta